MTRIRRRAIEYIAQISSVSLSQIPNAATNYNQTGENLSKTTEIVDANIQLDAGQIDVGDNDCKRPKNVLIISSCRHRMQLLTQSQQSEQLDYQLLMLGIQLIKADICTDWLNCVSRACHDNDRDFSWSQYNYVNP